MCAQKPTRQRGADEPFGLAPLMCGRYGRVDGGECNPFKQPGVVAPIATASSPTGAVFTDISCLMTSGVLIHRPLILRRIAYRPPSYDLLNYHSEPPRNHNSANLATLSPPLVFNASPSHDSYSRRE
jgi:hypothetical protein